MHICNIALNQTDKKSCLKGPSILEEETDQKRKKMSLIEYVKWCLILIN